MLQSSDCRYLSGNFQRNKKNVNLFYDAVQVIAQTPRYGELQTDSQTLLSLNWEMLVLQEHDQGMIH